MDETLKRRLVGIGVISLLVLIVAWWLPDREDGQKRLNPETLPTETRVYDINQLNAGNTQSAQPQVNGGEPAEVGAAPPPDIEDSFGMALDEGATVAKAEAQEEKAAVKQKPVAAEPAAAPKPAAKPSIQPAPVVTKGTESKQVAAKPEPKPQPKPEPKPQPKPEPKPESKPAAPEPVVEEAPKAMPEGGWLVQVGSYSKQDNAESVRKQLAAKGYRVYVSTAQVNGTSYHRVRVGPYARKPEASNAADNLASLLKQKVSVMANN